MSQPRRDSLLRGGALLLLLAVLFVVIRSIGTERLRAIVDSAGLFGPIIYILLRAFASFVPLASGPIQLTSGVLFGFWLAVLYSVIGSTLGYTMSFWIARRYGREVVKQMVGESIDRVDALLDRLDSWTGLVTARLVFYFAYDFVAYAAGLSRVPYLVFALVTFILGAFPIALTVLAGLVGAGEPIPFLSEPLADFIQPFDLILR